MGLQKILIPPAGFVPSLILHKRAVCSQIHSHGLFADRTKRNQFTRNAHILLFGDHAAHGLLIIIGFLMARYGTLPQPKVPLGIEKPLLVKPGSLKTMVHICGQHKIILILY